MKKMKMFFVAAGLMLVTVGVFAGKAKYFSTAPLFAVSGTTQIQLSSSFTLPTTSILTGVPNSNGTPVTINDRSIAPTFYALEYQANSNLYPLYAGTGL